MTKRRTRVVTDDAADPIALQADIDAMLGYPDPRGWHADGTEIDRDRWERQTGSPHKGTQTYRRPVRDAVDGKLKLEVEDRVLGRAIAEESIYEGRDQVKVDRAKRIRQTVEVAPEFDAAPIRLESAELGGDVQRI